MTTVYLYDPDTLEFQGEHVCPKGAFREVLYPAHYSPNKPGSYDAATQTCKVQLPALTWDIQDKPAPVLSLDDARTQQTVTLYGKCCLAIMSGFTCSALGTATSYPSAVIDQINLLSAAAAGGQLQCEQGGVWALRQHTAAQAAQVAADFVAWRNKCQAELVTLNAQVNATDATVETVQAVVWVTPT